ncbi:MAG: hypothetical protein J6S07_01755, partial [Bacteroidaceae bacterium]|nr:hypothetical protein [Bacteroidaceae bacterium]
YCIFGLLYYAEILDVANPVSKFLIIFYSVFAIPVIYSTLTAKASITNHTLYYKANSPNWISFKKKHAIPLKNVTEISSAIYNRNVDVLNIKMSDGKKYSLSIEYFLKKDLFRVLNQMLSSAIVQEDDAPKSSLCIHPVTGLFSGTVKDLEIYINGQPVSRDTATDVFHGQASHGDLIAIRKGDSFLFKYLNESEDVEYVLELPTTLIKTSPEDVKTTVRRMRNFNALLGCSLFAFLIAVFLWGNKAFWLLLALPLWYIISSFTKRKK